MIEIMHAETEDLTKKLNEALEMARTFEALHKAKSADCAKLLDDYDRLYERTHISPGGQPQ